MQVAEEGFPEHPTAVRQVVADARQIAGRAGDAAGRPTRPVGVDGEVGVRRGADGLPDVRRVELRQAASAHALQQPAGHVRRG